MASMASEVLRFRVARAPQRGCVLEDPRRPALRVVGWLEGSDLIDRLVEARAEERGRLAVELAGGDLARAITSIAQLDVGWAEQLATLDEWLRGEQNQPEVGALRSKVYRLFDRAEPEPDPGAGGGDGRGDGRVVPGEGDGDDADGEPAGGRAAGFAVDDPLRRTARGLAGQLVAAALAGVPPTTQRNLLRAVLVLGLVELVLTSKETITAAADVLWALRDRLVLLPEVLFPTPFRSALARRPGFADLYVVRQEWNRYVPGEIAHIENVLAGEFKERVLTRTDEAETTVTVETERDQVQERDVQSTSRSELSENSQSDTSLAVHVEGQVETHGQYGPTKVDTHLGGSLDYSVDESKSHATQQANEVVTRAVNRVEQRVREARTTRALTRVEEKDTHRFDGLAKGVAGMYRWVDKVMRLRTYRYPHRFLLEFEVPEPAAYLRWLELGRADKGFRIPRPAPFTRDGQPESAQNPPLLPTDISEDSKKPGYYLALAARWHAVGITAPPPAEVTVSGWLRIPSGDPAQDKTSHDLWTTPLEGSASGSGSAGGVEGAPLTIPDGYEAGASWSGWLMTWDQDDAIRPAWNTSKDASVTWVPPAAVVTVGDSQSDPSETGDVRNVVVKWGTASWVSKPISGQLNGQRSGTLPISVLAGNYGMISVQVHLTCLRQAGGALLAWQLATYEKLRAAYFELLRAHEEERAAREVRAGAEIEGRSPLENARVVREELKRQVVELLLGSPFSGLDDLTFDADGRPHTQIQQAVGDAPLLQFLEQVFEWENLTYVLYPYLWASADRWDELEGIQSPDPDYARFLRAGSARVVLSARPGFAAAVLFFIATGVPWTGGPAPAPGDPEYVSVAQEIQAQTGAPDDGEPVGSSWEVRLPTTLVWLDPDPTLPKLNQEATLPAPDAVPEPAPVPAPAPAPAVIGG
jgi:hypothetical protein